MSNSADTRKVGSLLFIGALALLFALQWGPGSQGCEIGKLPEPQTAATVNGQPIPLSEFATSYNQQADSLRRQGVPAEMLKQFGIHKQVLDNLVNAELLAQAAEKKGVAASDEDLKRSLKEIPAFQKNGRFDFETYKQILEYDKQTQTGFEDKLRRQLSAQRLIELVESSVVVSDEEVKARYLKDGNTARATFVRFTPTMFVDQVKAPRPAELEAWAKANEKAIADHYEMNKFSYFVPEKVKARQILLRFPADATAEQKAEIKTRAENVRKQIVDEKKPFAEVAKAASEDTETKDKGGELGFVDRLQLPGAFADLLFALQPGEVTVPVETPLGYYVGTVEEKKAPEQRPLEAVRTELATQLYLKDKAKALAKAAAEKALADVKAGKKLAELFPPAAKDPSNQFAINQESKPEAKETGEFSPAADAIPLLGSAPEAQKIIFDRKDAGLVDMIVTVGDALAVVVVDERKVPTDEDYEAKKAQLKIEAIKGKQFEVREAFLKALKQSGTVVVNDKAIETVISGES
ncbi:MAG: SurA N-terminal domain-containing protein [Myxococcota bacterium]